MELKEKLYQEIQKYDDRKTLFTIKKLTLVSTALFSALVSSGSMEKHIEKTVSDTRMNRPKMVESAFSLSNTQEYDPIASLKQLRQMFMDAEAIKMEQENILNLSNEEKIEKILEKFNLTDYQLNVMIACVIAEAGPTSYEEAYNVINTMYNRTICSRWVRSHGSNIYSQCIAPNQFVVFQDKCYIKYLDVDETYPGYQAVIDFLFTQKSVHNYLNFLSKDSSSEGSVQFVPNGNRYSSPIKDYERLEEQISIEEEQKQKSEQVVLKYIPKID